MTIQPIDELGVDAAIIFSDILVIPEAMGLPYELIEKKGPIFPKTIESAKDIDQLISGPEAANRLDYVYKAIEITVQELDNKVPLIGFCGAPWTILSYMIEGSGSKTFSKARKFLHQHPDLAHNLLQKITDTSIAYLHKKIQSGCSLVQIFDSWAGILSPELFNRFALPYISQICESIKEVPTIVFAKGAWFALQEIARLDCEVIGLDWNTKPAWARSIAGPEKVFQGNFDPSLLYSDKKTIQRETLRMIKRFGNRYIANLGHGVYPDTPLENVKVFVETIKNFRYNPTIDQTLLQKSLKASYL